MSATEQQFLSREELSVLYQILRRWIPETTSFYDFFRLLKKTELEDTRVSPDDSVSVRVVKTRFIEPLLAHYVLMASYCVPPS